eukprot:TRINITY_DN680_c0_g1_i8.p1 TRINITY_DN680_c0_g1~~TRINITY_DN680_c0_g1_i8.p1  ORF type:complete len:338 (+),score=79.31 TRINITY_DN680_c0_g1_i8:166-1179(+)
MVARLKDASLSVILLVAVEGFRFPIDADEFDWRDPVKKAIPRAGRAGLSRSTQHLDRSSSPKVSKAASLVELGSERTRLGPRSVVPMKFQDSQLPKSSTPEPLAGHNSQSLGANLRILADNISSLLANIKSESEGYTGATPEPDYATCLKQNEKMRVVTQKMRVVHEALDDDIRSVLGLLSEMQPEKSDGSHKPKKEESDGSDKPKKEESDGSDKPKKEDPNAEDPNAAASGSTTLPAKDPNVAASGSTTLLAKDPTADPNAAASGSTTLLAKDPNADPNAAASGSTTLPPKDPNVEGPNAAASGSTTLPAKDPNVAASGSTTLLAKDPTADPNAAA